MENKPKSTKKVKLKIQHLMEVIMAERFGDLDVDFKACEELLEISKREKYLYGTAFAYAYMGDCLIGKNDSVSASPYLMQAKELCERHRFLDLLPYVCNWLGIYYEIQNDRQMAMQCYLDALEFAERNNDLFRQSILLNNIASQFHNCGSYKVAKEYYVKAFERYKQFEHSSVEDPHYAQMTANIISVCFSLKQIEDAKMYYALLEKSGQLVKNQSQLYVCELLISVGEGDIESIRMCVDKLILEMRKQPKHIYQFFNTFLVVAESMIVLNEVEHAKKLLHILDGFCKEEEYGRKLKVQYIWMKFYISFGTEQEKNMAYERFYKLRKLSDDVLNHNLADGLAAKIKLRESIKKNQEIEKANEALEDEILFDELTHIYNRRSFRKITERVAADKSVDSLSFVMIDVDYFKQYNDSYGHSKGDDTLRAVAESMKSVSDDNIYNFRYGGDEYISMCKNMTVEEVEAYIKAFKENLDRKKIEHLTSLCGNQVTLSIGYSHHDKISGKIFDVTTMMTEADKALYWSKGQGRNCHHLFTAKMQKL